MNLPYFSILHWLILAFFIILFIALSLLSAQAKKTNVIVSAIFASFLVTFFGAILSIIILEKYTKKGSLIRVSEYRILFNETLVVKGEILNVGKLPLGYCKVSLKLINNDRKVFGKGSFFKSGGVSVFGNNEKQLQKPNTIIKEQLFRFKPPLRKGQSYPFSMTLNYPPYFRGYRAIKKIYCH
jgi:hypothetical protein